MAIVLFDYFDLTEFFPLATCTINRNIKYPGLVI